MDFQNEQRTTYQNSEATDQSEWLKYDNKELAEKFSQWAAIMQARPSGVLLQGTSLLVWATDAMSVALESAWSRFPRLW